jgi:hypothetical protein
LKNRTIRRGTVAAVALLAAMGGLSPARAAARYDFAVGAGLGARYWQTSQWNPGTCTIDVDHAATKTRAELNAVDSVVLSPAEIGVLGRINVPVSWGATQQPPVGAKLLIRFVYFGAGCPHTDFTFTAPSFLINVPANVRFIVVSAGEGAVQPWFTI